MDAYNKTNEPVHEKTNNLGSDQVQYKLKITRSLKFRMKEIEGLYFPSRKNKGTDQLRGHRKAGLCLYFRICRLLVFLCSGSIVFIDKTMSSFMCMK